ncbi:hypothetical protein DBR32_06525 [Taibaiella sp. KBW10]|uniref:hypothetical protein n=1 Tax=Taibaiella sp. KBW10 TaxID=2153357 RepID=UPI000F59ACD8|nr:hypothetical protein [Taibaiella sp. KBW10]RQO31605.1 hypothetical protein DBR32_06525 [Taibaiella sp. KBW10]
MRYFLFASLLLLSACKVRSYQQAQAVPAAQKATYPSSSLSFQPKFDKVLYNCVVDGRSPLGKKYHLSGLLFIKQLDDSSTRVVFQNQMGISYFDFGWSKDNTFTVHSIMPQMDKAALIKTLKKDFELLLFKHLPDTYTGMYHMPKDPGKVYMRFALSKGFVYYIFEGAQLHRIENADERKKVIVMQLAPTAIGTLPESVMINHLRAHFSIQLQQLQPNLIKEENDVITE